MIPGSDFQVDLRDGRKSIPVEIVSLDDYFKNIKDPIDFIKIDVQGAEMAVIDGMSDLWSDPSKIKNLQALIEFCPLALEDNRDCIRGQEPQKGFGSLEIGRRGTLFALKVSFRAGFLNGKRVNLLHQEQRLFENERFLPNFFFNKTNLQAQR